MNHIQIIALAMAGGHILMTTITGTITHFSWKRRLGHGEGLVAATIIGSLWLFVLPLIVVNYARGGDWLCNRTHGGGGPMGED